MKIADVKTTNFASNQAQAKRKPFFNKEGERSFFSDANDTTQSFFSTDTIQAKLTIGKPNDKYEVEADAMADKVVQRLNTPKGRQDYASQTNKIQAKCSHCQKEEKVLKKENDELLQNKLEIQRKSIFESNGEQPEANIQTKSISSTVVQKKCTECEQEEKLQMKDEEELSEEESTVQKKSMDGGTEIPSNFQNRLNSSRSGGSHLPNYIQTSMGEALGADFSGIKVHTGSEAIQMNKDIGAQAFTHGNNIYFNEGKYDTNSNSGKHLLAHELTHTLQQNSQISLEVQRYPGDDEFAAPEPDEEMLAISDEELTEFIRSNMISITYIVDSYGGLRGLERTHPNSYQVARHKMEVLLGEEKLQAVYDNERNIRNLVHRSGLITDEMASLMEYYNETEQDEAYDYINEIYDEYDLSYSSVIELIKEEGINVLLVLNLFIRGNPYEISEKIERYAEAVQAQQVALERERAQQTEIGEQYVGDVVGTQEILMWWDDEVTLESLMDPTYGYDTKAEALVWARISGKAVAVKEIEERFYIYKLNYQYSYKNLQAWRDSRRTDFVRSRGGRQMTLVTTDGVVLNPGRGQNRFYGESQYRTGGEDFEAAAAILEQNSEELNYDTQYSLFKDMLRTLAFQNLSNAKSKLGDQIDEFFEMPGIRHRMLINQDAGADLRDDTARLKELLGDAAILGNNLDDTSTEEDQQILLGVLAEIGEIQTNNPVASLFINDANEAGEQATRENIEDELSGMQSGDAAWTAASELGRRMNNIEIVQRHLLQDPDAVLKLTPLHAQVLTHFEPLAQEYIKLRLGVHTILEIAQTLGLAVAEISLAVAGFLIGGPVGIALTVGTTAYGAYQAMEAFQNLDTLRAMSELDVEGRLQFASQEQVESAEFWAYVGAGLTLLDLAGFSSSVRAMTRARGAIQASEDLVAVNTRTQQNLSQVAELMGESEQALVARLNAASGLERTRLNREISEIMEVVGPHGNDMKSIGWVSDETIDLFRNKPELIEAYANNSAIRALLKHCHSPCFPESLTPRQIEYMEDFLDDLGSWGLSIEDLGISSRALRESFEAASEDEAWEIIVKLENSFENTTEILSETGRGRALYNEEDLASAIDDGLGSIVGRHMTSVQGAYEIGERMGREYASRVLGFTDSGWVNPFQFRRSRFGQGFDDLMEDAAGNLWIIEYKGGTATLSAGQMSARWVASRIRRYRREGGELGEHLADMLETAQQAGRLKGIALSTPIDGRTIGTTVEIRRWTY